MKILYIHLENKFQIVTPEFQDANIIMRVFVPMPTHCTIMCFGFLARWIDAVECGLFSNHAPLGQTALRVG